MSNDLFVWEREAALHLLAWHSIILDEREY